MNKKRFTPARSRETKNTISKYEKIPKFCIAFLILAALCAIIYTIACLSPKFADFFNIYIAAIFRWLLALIPNIIPISLAEILIILLPVILILVIVLLIKYRCKSFKASLVSTLCVISVASLIFSSFTLTLATGYRGSTLDKKLGIERKDLNTEELYDSAIYLGESISALAKEISYGEDGFSKMPYGLGELNKKLLEAYRIFAKEHYFISTFSSRVKPVMLSELMSYTHITGVYTFFTGEANLNVNFPDYTLPFTAAHELAHQRGISREDEANMTSFLVCLESDDTYIRYSAQLNVYEYILSALKKADRELYLDAWSRLDKNVKGEITAYSTFFNKYRDSNAGKVSGNINNSYLKSQGTVGTRSYGMVVDLTVAYLKNEEKIK